MLKKMVCAQRLGVTLRVDCHIFIHCLINNLENPMEFSEFIDQTEIFVLFD